jgi:hypothetical protein
LPPHRRAIAAYRALRGFFVPAEVRVVTDAEAIWNFVLALLPSYLQIDLPGEGS